MNEQDLRQIVRAVVQKRLAVPGPGSNVQGSVDVLGPGSAAPSYVPETVPFGDHASHALYLQLMNAGGSCVIEEHVSCDHCGYCKSHGH
jgi:hypothetical protein